MPVCPGCGSKKTKYAHGEMSGKEGFVIVRERRCVECDMLFHPPIPFWAPYVAILTGVLLMVGGVGIIVALVADYQTNRGSQNVRWGQLIVFLLLLFGGGGALIYRGVRMVMGNDRDPYLLKPMSMRENQDDGN